VKGRLCPDCLELQARCFEIRNLDLHALGVQASAVFIAATVEDNETIRRRRDVVSSHIVKTTLARLDNRIDVGEKAFFRFDWKSFFVTHDPIYDEHRHCLGSRDGPPSFGKHGGDPHHAGVGS
jgi:hypothetical protein